MSERPPARATRAGNVVVWVLAAILAVVYAGLVVRQALAGTVFWPTVAGSLFVLATVGTGSLLLQRKRRALEQTDPEEATRYRHQTTQWAWVLAVVGVLLLGLALFLLYR